MRCTYRLKTALVPIATIWLMLFAAFVGVAQNTAVFPTRVATNSDLYVATNNFSTTLLTGITSTATSASVASGTGMTAPGLVTIDNEILAVCQVSGGGTLTFGKSACPNVDGRGVDGSTASSHLASRAVQGRVVATLHNQLAAEVIALEVRASHLIYVTDHGAKCDGSTDDSTAIQDVITGAPAGSSVIFPGGTGGCVLNTGLTISKILTLTADAPTYPTAQLLAGADISMITLTGDGSRSKLSSLGLDANGHSGAKGVVLAGTVDSPVTNVTLDHVTWNGNFLDALTGTYNYFITYKDTRVFGAQTGFLLGPQSNSQIMMNVSFQENQAAVADGINWRNSELLTIHGLTMECGTIFSASNSYGASIIGGYGENIGSGCAAMSISDGGATNQAYVNFGTAFGGSPAYGNTVRGMLFNGSAAYGVKIGYGQGVQIDGNRFNTELLGVIVDIQPGASQAISAATNAATPTFTVPSTPYSLESTQTVKISGFTSGWSSVNGTYPATNVSSTTFTATGAPDTTGFGAISGTPVAQFYAVNKDIHIGSNSYGSPLTQANAIGFTTTTSDITATNVSSLMATPFIATYGMPVPQTSHLKPGYGALYWHTLDGTSMTGGSWHGLWNNNGTSTATLPLWLPELYTAADTGTGSTIPVHGSMSFQPRDGTSTKSAGSVIDNLHRIYIYENGSGSSQRLCGSSTDYAAVICTNDDLPVELGGGNIIQLRILAQNRGIQQIPTTVSSLGTCGSTVAEGTSKPVSDSDTATFNATIAGGGSNHVIAYCNGSNWVAH